MEVYYTSIDLITYNESWVENMAGLYKAMSSPIYGEFGLKASPSAAQFRPPPKLYLKVGDLFDNIPCVLTSFSRELADGQWSNKNSSLITKGVSNKEKMNFLPKWQKFSLGFTTSYSLGKDKKAIGFKESLLRQEGVTRGG